MTSDNNKVYAGGAIALVLAAATGFGVARWTGNDAVMADQTVQSGRALPASGANTDVVAITPEGITTSQITIAPAMAGSVSGIIPASATVEATPDAGAVLTARAAGTVTRIFKRLGDPIRAGETLALVESRDASAIAADRSAAAARVTLASRQLGRERTLLAQGVSPRADFETAQANLAVAQADARRASAAAGAARVAADGRSVAVISPIGGRVTAAPASLGQFVAAETELFRVADPRRLQIAANVPPADAARIKAGDRVELVTNTGQKVEGRVRSETGVVDPQTRQATIIVTPTGGGGLIVPGQIVQARIFASKEGGTGAVTVPQDAVQTLGERNVVFVRTRGGFRAQDVQVGTRSAGMIEIVTGLSAGTPIATTNAFLLKAELGKESAE